MFFARLKLCVTLSGASALIAELTWMRQLGLATGSTGLALTWTLTTYMLGLGLGGLLSARFRMLSPARTYALAEMGAAIWLLIFPSLLGSFAGWLSWEDPLRAAPGMAFLLLPPALCHGATLPALTRAHLRPEQTGSLYALNTVGAVGGVLLATFFLFPLLGIRGTELVAVGLAVGAALGSFHVLTPTQETPKVTPAGRAPTTTLMAASAAGFSAMALEVCWSRLGALLVGGSVYAFAIVLATYLLGVAIGAAWGRRSGVGIGNSLALLGLLALIGTASWGVLPHLLAALYALGGDTLRWPGTFLLLATCMAGAPIASGAVFTASLRTMGGGERATANILAANTLGSVCGAAFAGLWGLPHLGLWATAQLSGMVCLVLGLLPGPKRLFPLALMAAGLALLLLGPAADRHLYAVGVGVQLDRFVDLSPRAIERFAHEGWQLLSVEDGHTATVAVGESSRTGNRWLSINGKVDASTGADMPTQVLSGRIPLAFVQGPAPTGVVVGLATGVTAGEALDAGLSEVLVLELEPAVVRAAHAFTSVNRGVLDDPRATIRVADARAYLARDPHTWDVIISEPSNPWLTGVSNLFTREYWEIGKSRLKPQGVYCQWVQLYALPPRAFRSLVRTFTEVMGDVWLFETIPGADALLVAAPGPLPNDLPLAPTLSPAQVRRLGGVAPLNTDDRPWIEFEAPKWVLRSTAEANQSLIAEAAATPP
jgi:spermidine synthase